MTAAEFDMEHAEAMVEGARQVIGTLKKFEAVMDKSRPTDADFAQARALLDKAREQIEEFDVKDCESFAPSSVQAAMARAGSGSWL